MKTKGQQILIAGGAGFIGYHLTKRLLNAGESVLCVDDFSTGCKANLQEFIGCAQFQWVEHDIVHPLQVEADVKAIFNLACPASPVHYQKNPVHTLRTNVWGVVNLLELAKEKHCPLLQASTSEVYGDPTVSEQDETYWGHVNPVGMRSCYDEGKRCAETFCMDYHRQYGTNVKIVRIFNTYGPKMRANDGRVVPNFILQALRNAPITIYGDGAQTRSFTYVDDLVDGMLKMIQTDKDFVGPVNLGNPDERSIKELAEIIVRKTNSKSCISHVALPSDDPRRRHPIIRMAQSVLDWKPQVQLDEGLQRTIEYFINTEV